MRVRSQRCVLWSAGSTPSVCTVPPLRLRNPSRISTVVVFPAPFGPEQGEDLALLHLEADVAHRHRVPVGLGQVLHADRRHYRPPSHAACCATSATGRSPPVTTTMASTLPGLGAPAVEGD